MSSFVDTLTKSGKKKTEATLIRIETLLSDKAHWTAGSLALDEYGYQSTDRHDIPTKDATSYCLVGAARKVNGAYEKSALRVLAEAAAEMLGVEPDGPRYWRTKHPYPYTVVEVNDEKGYKAVRTLLRTAIKKVAL